jgi:transcription elongation factor Elf1
MKHEHEANIKCPYCDWEDKDSWEFGQEDGTHTCGNCECEFNVQPYISATYSTSRIDCEEKGSVHNYQFQELFISKQKFNQEGLWINLPETEWKFTKIMVCSFCGDENYIQITKEEYQKEINNP